MVLRVVCEEVERDAGKPVPFGEVGEGGVMEASR
jgi:hypothetical protein